MAGLDSNTKLLLHCDGTDGSTTFTDVSDSGHTVNVTATVEVDTAFKKWGTGAALFDGDSGYFSIDDSPDWDIVGSNSTNRTIDFWVRMTDHDGDEIYIHQWESNDDRWLIYHRHGAGIFFEMMSGGVQKILVPAGGEITDSNWHHIALCKLADKYGIYKGGTQVGYIQDDDTDTFAGALEIGRHGDGTAHFDGHIDEIRIQHSNIFGAAPNATPDDTITVPTRQYGLLTQPIFLE